MGKDNHHRHAKLSLIPLGGIGEIGKNMLVVRYGRGMIVIDCGLKFPEDELLGIDMVIPDMTYLVEHQEDILGVVVTHGHEDHIGALPYLLKQIKTPVYGTKLTLGLVAEKLREHDLSRVTLHEIKAGGRLELGCFKLEFIHVNHSIADVVALAIHTPVGVVVHTSDFKIDYTPIAGAVTDLHKFGKLGVEGVLVLLSDSTNADRSGYTMSEKTVGDIFEENFRMTKGRIIVATFASNIYRIQQIINAAVNNQRRVVLAGRSMINVASIARELGYLQIPEGILVDLEEIDNYPPEEIVIISTGSQGEPMSALTRMAALEHKKIRISADDLVIISALPIPGNEKLVTNTINNLFKQGAKVIYEAVSGVHVSGHASQEELKLMINMVKPKFFIPVHGEYRHLVQHAQLASELGIPGENIFIPNIGDILEVSSQMARISGKVTAGNILVDGLGVGDVGNMVLKERRQLAQDGIFIITLAVDLRRNVLLAKPEIVSRGFVYMKESEELIGESRDKVCQIVDEYLSRAEKELSALKNQIRDQIGKYLYEKTKRRPMILLAVCTA
ncbi:MAG: ribonuclease J [Bacillota bacterium]